MKVVCFGDSNTYGYDPRSYIDDRYPEENRWVDIIAQTLGCETVNAGQNGQEIPSRERELEAINRMLSGQEPIDLLTIMLGSNDLLQGNSTDAIVKRMERFLEQIALDKTRILLIGPPPMKRGTWVLEQYQIDDSVEMNNAYKELAERLGTAFVNAGKWNVPLAYDGVHFTEAGHVVFAEGLVNYLKKEYRICWKSI